MKKILLTLLLPFLVFSCQQWSPEKETVQYEVSQDFVQGSEDIPLLVEMERIYESSIGFDTESGSIINSSYLLSTTIPSGLDHAKEFYIDTLPQMGWSLEKEMLEKITFKRDNETLEIEFVNYNGENIVKFFLASTL